MGIPYGPSVSLIAFGNTIAIIIAIYFLQTDWVSTQIAVLFRSP
ncbi:hypothetical protein [Bacillus toyonensis]|nr:hypothetical protein [Bacillus toyonensis]